MQGLLSLRGALRRRLKDERGWALIDAIASAVVVVLAFTGTTMAFNGATASVQRDAKKTQALIVAQNELNEMRGTGQRNINSLLALDNTTTSVAFKGTTYNVEFDAYYVTGLGSDQQDACAVSFSAGGGTARYIYMRASVTYAGQTSGAAATANPYLTKPAALDSYYSPEGGGVQADTGTLRVFVLDRRGVVATGTTGVVVSIMGDPAEKQPTSSNPATGCYLFTGLVRNTYQVKVSVPTKQDMYMSNTTTANKVTLPVVMPDRGALSRDIRIDNPVTVTAKYQTKRISDNAYTDVKTANGPTNPFFDMWIAATDQIRTAPTADYAYAPSGMSFMPHLRSPSATQLPTGMFPNASGYSAYAGPCNANYPNAGQPTGTNRYVPTPTVLTDVNWGPGGSFSPLLTLTQLRSKITLTGFAANSPATLAANTTYMWGPGFDTTATSLATVKVRLTGDAAGGTTTAVCKPATDLFNKWVTIGSLTASGVTLSDNLMALPVGMYDVCVRLPWKVYRRSTNSSAQWDAAGANTATATTYFSRPDVPLLFDAPVDDFYKGTWTSPNNATPAWTVPTGATASSTDCSA